MTKEVGRQKWQRRRSTTGEGMVEKNKTLKAIGLGRQLVDGQMITGDYPQPKPLVK